MSTIGILAYGSLITDPGSEMTPSIERKIRTTTPFPVEYARFSRSRCGAPTVVPHASGCFVNAVIFVLKASVTLEENKNLLWRRETRNEGTGRTYAEKSLSNSVLIQDAHGHEGFEHVLYTDFEETGKIKNPDCRVLAKAAIDSVSKAEIGKDGISYLIDLITLGVITPLTTEYEQEILIQTNSKSLHEALRSVSGQRQS